MTLATVKLLVGRPKDLALVRQLHAAGRIEATVVPARIERLGLLVELKPRLLANFQYALDPVDR